MASRRVARAVAPAPKPTEEFESEEEFETPEREEVVPEFKRPRRALGEDYVTEVMGAEGIFSKAFDGYQVRTGQVDLTRKIGDVFKEGGALIAQAPTGTGKSVAALVPAIAKVVSEGKKTVVVTANIALQEQYVAKDLPMLRKLLPWGHWSFAIAKGIGNYLCRDQFEDSYAKTLLSGLEPGLDRSHWAEVQKWVKTTTAGDISELKFEPKRLLPMFTTTSEDCHGSKCKHYADCPAIKARHAVKLADVVVTNYHLFFADLMLKLGKSEGVLPKYEHLIFDEAHKVSDIAREFLGFRFSRGGLMRAVRLLDSPSKSSPKGPMPTIDTKLRESSEKLIGRFFEELGEHFESDNYEIRFKRRGQIPLAETLRVQFQQCAQVYAEARSTLPLTPERVKEVERAQYSCEKYAEQLLAVHELQSEKEWAYYIEKAGPSRYEVKAKPLMVNDFLRTNLFENDDEDWPVTAIVAMSATVTTGPGKFDFVARELGAESAETLEVPSPFNIPRQCILVSPPMIDVNSRDFQGEMGEMLESIIRITKGGVLALFTSKGNRDFARDYLRRARLPYTILSQDEAPRTQLIARFKEDVDSVLLGVESFWAGVDVPGEACRCVVIDRLPFAMPSDPLEDMLSAKMGKEYFPRHSTPKAIIQLCQGFGRGVRSPHDRCAVVVLDRRIVDKPYGLRFVRALPPGLPVMRSMDALELFFRKPKVDTQSAQ